MNKKLISFVIKAEMGFFKKPDINEGIYLTYNFIHKPAVLGILGAIVGLKGFQQNGRFPEYYQKLKELKVGIKPINDDKGTYKKNIITYSNTTGFASEEKGGNLIISEQTLLNPAYQIFLLLDLKNNIHKTIYEHIKNQKAEFLPYMGKNDYSLWWDKNDVVEYKWEKFIKDSDFNILTIFKKDEPVMPNVVEAVGRRALYEQRNWFCVFETLPIGYNETLLQYELADFAYTNATLKANMEINSESLFKIFDENNTKNAQVIFLY